MKNPASLLKKYEGCSSSSYDDISDGAVAQYNLFIAALNRFEDFGDFFDKFIRNFSLAKDKYIVVEYDDRSPIIPFELFNVPELGFLGFKVPFIHTFSSSGEVNRDSYIHDQESLLTNGNFHQIIGFGIDESELEEESLKGILNAGRLGYKDIYQPLRSREITDAWKEGSDNRIAHFTSHLRIEDKLPLLPMTPIKDFELSYLKIARPSERPLIFLNSCMPMKDENDNLSLRTAGLVFNIVYPENCVGMIAAKVKINSANAVIFSEYFYEFLFKEGLSVMESMQRTRNKLNEECPELGVFGLLYSMHGEVQNLRVPKAVNIDKDRLSTSGSIGTQKRKQHRPLSVT